MLMTVINSNNNMAADSIHCLLMPCAWPAFKYLLFLWCLSAFPVLPHLIRRGRVLLLFPLYRWDDQSSVGLSNMFMATHWYVTSGDLNPTLCETVWSVLKHPLLICPDWQGLEQEDRMWREQTSFMVSFLLPENCEGAGGCWEVSRLIRSQLIRSQFLGSLTRKQLHRQKGKVHPVMKGAVRSPRMYGDFHFTKDFPHVLSLVPLNYPVEALQCLKTMAQALLAATKSSVELETSSTACRSGITMPSICIGPFTSKTPSVHQTPIWRSGPSGIIPIYRWRSVSK